LRIDANPDVSVCRWYCKLADAVERGGVAYALSTRQQIIKPGSCATSRNPWFRIARIAQVIARGDRLGAARQDRCAADELRLSALRPAHRALRAI
jgi:hypothetical protein